MPTNSHQVVTANCNLKMLPHLVYHSIRRSYNSYLLGACSLIYRPCLRRVRNRQHLQVQVVEHPPPDRPFKTRTCRTTSPTNPPSHRANQPRKITSSHTSTLTPTKQTRPSPSRTSRSSLRASSTAIQAGNLWPNSTRSSLLSSSILRCGSLLGANSRITSIWMRCSSFLKRRRVGFGISF